MLPFLHRMTPATTEDNPLWLVVLCDLMTNLMLFFLILFTFTVGSDADMQKSLSGLEAAMKGEDAPAETEKEKKAAEIVQKFKEEDTALAISEQLKKRGLEGVTEIDVTQKYVRVRMAGPVLFRSGRAKIIPQAKKTLDALGPMLKKMPNDIIVEGHTDVVPIVSGPYQTNWELSVARSYSVIEYFSKRFGLPEKRFITAGYGEHRPISSNATRTGRARNRRIEIVIVRKQS